MMMMTRELVRNFSFVTFFCFVPKAGKRVLKSVLSDSYSRSCALDC